MAVDDDPPRGREAEAGAGADVLGGEERVEHAVAVLGAGSRGRRRRCRPCAQLSVAARGDRDRAVLAERVDRVVEQVRPHLVELGAADGELGQRAVVVAHDLDRRVLELVPEHARASSRAPRAGRPRRARRGPCTRSCLTRLDEVGHPRASTPAARRRGPARGQRRRDPLRSRRRSPGRRRARTRSSHVLVDAGARRAARPAATARRRRGPRGARASASSASAASSASSAVAPPRRARAPRAGARRAPRRRSRSTPDSTKRPIVAPTTSIASASCAAARCAAAAGLLSSCARPAAIVPSDASRSRFCSTRGDAGS